MRETPILNSIPSGLIRKDVFILEGIRYAFNIIQISYQDLFDDLTSISKANHKKENIKSQSFYRVFKNAWSIIDFSWKLRNLILQINHPEENEVEINEQSEKNLNIEFFNKIRDFRNTFQHLDERISEVIVEENDSVWGNISWIYVINKQKIHSCLLYPGHPRTSSKIINPGGLKINFPICHITLTSINRKKEKLELNISKFMDEIDEFMHEFESILEVQLNQMDNSTKLVQDMIFTAEISFKKN